MKQIFTLLILISSVAVSAQDEERRRNNDFASGTISVSNLSNQNFTVFLDGREYRTDARAEVFIDRVFTGQHTLKIILQRGRRQSGSPFLNNHVVYHSRIYVSEKSDLEFVVSRKGKVLVDEDVINYGASSPWDHNGYGSAGYNSIIDQRDFERIKQSITNARFEDDKLMIAKQVINSNFFGVSQVKELLQLFSFDSNKLDIAKLAYGRTIDRNNYFTVYDVFSFSSSKQELNRYIMNYRS